jgi:hypothetical protein
MPTTAEPMNARPRPAGRLAELFADGWPAFIGADQEVKRQIGPVRDAFADLELVLLDPDDVPVVAGWAVPITWDGEPAGLPEGYTGFLARSLWLRHR